MACYASQTGGDCWREVDLHVEIATRSCAHYAGNVGNLPMVLVAALCEDRSSAVAHAVEPGRCYELGIAYVVFAMWVAGDLRQPLLLQKFEAARRFLIRCC